MRSYFIVHLFAVLVAGAPAIADAQGCSLFPADCPSNRPDPYGSPEDSIALLDNPVLPREITMENRLREKVMAVSLLIRCGPRIG